MALTKNEIAKRIAQELVNNTYVNLGIGIPTLVANHVPSDINVEFQSENGILGMGPFPKEGKEDADLINAGKQTITSLPGAVLFDSALSFSMIRGNHIHLSVLGAMQVAENGDLANWKIPGKMVKGMGGAMDLVTSSNNIIVAMTHTNRQGQSKLLKRCTLPITGVSCVKKIVTDLAVIEVTSKGFKLTEVAPGVSKDEIINLLPHREPMLLIDELIDIVKLKSAKAIVNVKKDSFYVDGHFPDNPVLPGVLIVEAFGQAAAALTAHGIDKKEYENKLVFLMSVEKARFRNPVIPNCKLELKIEAIRSHGRVWKYKGEAFVEGKKMSDAQWSATIVDSK